MAAFRISFSQISAGAGANAFRTIAGIVAGAAARGKLLSLDLAAVPTNSAPDDQAIAVRVTTTNQAGAGTPASTPTPAKVDPGNPIASLMNTGVDYVSAEPTTLQATPHPFESAFNSRGGMSKVWGDKDAPRWGASQTLVIQIASSLAGVEKITGTVVWEE